MTNLKRFMPSVLMLQVLFTASLLNIEGFSQSTRVRTKPRLGERRANNKPPRRADNRRHQDNRDRHQDNRDRHQDNRDRHHYDEYGYDEYGHDRNGRYRHTQGYNCRRSQNGYKTIIGACNLDLSVYGHSDIGIRKLFIQKNIVQRGELQGFQVDKVIIRANELDLYGSSAVSLIVNDRVVDKVYLDTYTRRGRYILNIPDHRNVIGQGIRQIGLYIEGQVKLQAVKLVGQSGGYYDPTPVRTLESIRPFVMRSHSSHYNSVDFALLSELVHANAYEYSKRVYAVKVIAHSLSERSTLRLETTGRFGNKQVLHVMPLIKYDRYNYNDRSLNNRRYYTQDGFETFYIQLNRDISLSQLQLSVTGRVKVESVQVELLH